MFSLFAQKLFLLIVCKYLTPASSWVLNFASNCFQIETGGGNPQVLWNIFPFFFLCVYFWLNLNICPSNCLYFNWYPCLPPCLQYEASGKIWRKPHFKTCLTQFGENGSNLVWSKCILISSNILVFIQLWRLGDLINHLNRLFLSLINTTTAEWN